MGCVASVPIRTSIMASIHSLASEHEKDCRANSIQDEARSFRSKVSAIKMLTRAESSFTSLMSYLQEIGKAEYLVCFKDMEEIKHVPDDQLVSRISALVWRYKTIFEEVKILEKKPKSVDYLIWDCLGKLKNVDSIENISLEVVKKYLVVAQNEILARLIIPFENYLQSKQYKQWQEGQIDAERKRQHHHGGPTPTPISSAMSVRSDVTTQAPYVVGGGLSGKHPTSNSTLTAAAPGPVRNGSMGSTSQARPPTCSDVFPDILVVDDSVVTLKLAKLTLERDGHNVDKAINGHVALELMKKRNYDVVLIDLNMPVMDGFETVRLFREYEKENNQSFPSDLSSISDSNDDDPVFAASNRRAGFMSNRRDNPPKSSNNLHNLSNAGSKLPSFARSSKIEPEDHQVNPAAEEPNAIPGEEGAVGTGTSETPPVTDPNTKIIGLQDRDSLLKVDSKFIRGITPEHYHQMIIGMSTNIDEQTKARALEAGMDHFLPKPFTLQKFIEAIKLSRDQKTQQAQPHPNELLVPLAQPTNSNSNSNSSVARPGPGHNGHKTVSIHADA